MCTMDYPKLLYQTRRKNPLVSKGLKDVTLCKENNLSLTIKKFPYRDLLLGCVAQSVTCLATDASLTAGPGVASSISALSHTFLRLIMK